MIMSKAAGNQQAFEWLEHPIEQFLRVDPSGSGEMKRQQDVINIPAPRGDFTDDHGLL